MTPLYSAFTETDTPFASLEEAVNTLNTLPWMGEREVQAVSVVTQRDSGGITAEVASGTANPDDPQALVYLVDVQHAVGGVVIPIRYLIEFGVENGADSEDGNSPEVGPGDEEDASELGEGSGQGFEEPDPVPSGDPGGNEAD